MKTALFLVPRIGRRYNQLLARTYYCVIMFYLELPPGLFYKVTCHHIVMRPTAEFLEEGVTSVHKSILVTIYDDSC